MYNELTELPEFKSLVFQFVILLVFIGVIVISHRTYLLWKRLPTLEQYLQAHPNCRTDRGIKCSQCGSSSIKNWGLDKADDGRRKHICNHCNTTLYRSG